MFVINFGKSSTRCFHIFRLFAAPPVLNLYGRHNPEIREHYIIFLLCDLALLVQFVEILQCTSASTIGFIRYDNYE
jgi:hypothetical protein